MSQNAVRLVVMGLAMLSVAACATAPAAPPTVDVTGTWEGQWRFVPETVGGGTVAMSIKQTGAQVTGDVQVIGPALTARPTRVEGVVSGNDFRVQGSHVTGWLTVKGDEMSGVVNGMLPARLELKRKK